MTASGSKSSPSVGFLTICECADRSLLGGYLVLNLAGRPLEFHCTAPVRPSRAQEILYGPTLKPFLYGEQIGATLVNKAVSEPLFVCTDVEPALALREHAKVPVLLILGDETRDLIVHTSPDRSSPLRLDAPHAVVPQPSRQTLLRFTLGGNPVAVANACESDRDGVLRRWPTQGQQLDLAEPFTRIREAIEEAQRGPGRSPR